MNFSEFSPSVIEKIKYYVYLLKDPETNEVFYVGKGEKNRVFVHVNDALKDQKETDKLHKKIREIRAKGGTVKYEILRHGLEENEAFEVEAALIDHIGLSELTNKIYGYDASNRGKMSIDEIIAKYCAKLIDIKEPSVLIIINQQFGRNISQDELYEITRGNWVMGEKRRKDAKFAFAIKNGVVRQVYKINKWDSINVTDLKGKQKKRWQFEGEVALDLQHYIGGSVESYLGKKGAQNPIRYVNC